MQCQPLDEALHATGTVLPTPLASPLHVTDSLDAKHDCLAQIAAELVPGALLPTTHLGVPLLEEARLGPHDICAQHRYPSTILVIMAPGTAVPPANTSVATGKCSMSRSPQRRSKVRADHRRLLHIPGKGHHGGNNRENCSNVERNEIQR
jgi:hypothetical protein